MDGETLIAGALCGVLATLIDIRNSLARKADSCRPSERGEAPGEGFAGSPRRPTGLADGPPGGTAGLGAITFRSTWSGL